MASLASRPGGVDCGVAEIGSPPSRVSAPTPSPPCHCSPGRRSNVLGPDAACNELRGMVWFFFAPWTELFRYFFLEAWCVFKAYRTTMRVVKFSLRKFTELPQKLCFFRGKYFLVETQTTLRINFSFFRFLLACDRQYLSNQQKGQASHVSPVF